MMPLSAEKTWCARLRAGGHSCDVECPYGRPSVNVLAGGASVIRCGVGSRAGTRSSKAHNSTSSGGADLQACLARDQALPLHQCRVTDHDRWLADPTAATVEENALYKNTLGGL